MEKFVGISGNKDSLATLPDGDFLPPHEMSCVETYFKDKIGSQYKDRHVVIRRAAHLTQPQPIHFQQGRAQCQHRTLCERGCPYGGYFSSNASTIPWAARTGKLTLQPDSIVHSLIYDEQKGKATGVRVIDTHTKQLTEYYARIIFINASALHTNLILLNSTSNRFPNGLGNDSGLLGQYMAFHNYRGRITAEFDGLPDKTTDGRRPNSSYMPRFRNVHKQETSGPASRFLRGYAATLYSSRGSVQNQHPIGPTLKQNLLNPTPGHWQVGSAMMGETISKADSTVRLDTALTDQYGIPQLRVSHWRCKPDSGLSRFDTFLSK